MGYIRSDAPVLRSNDWVDAARSCDGVNHLTLCPGDGVGELPPPPSYLLQKKPGGAAASGVSVRDRVRAIKMRTNDSGPSTAAKPAPVRPTRPNGAFSCMGTEVTPASPIVSPSPEKCYVRCSGQQPLPVTALEPHLRPPVPIENAIYPQGTSSLCLRHGRYGSRSA